MREVLWFFDPSCNDPFAIDGRCLVRYVDGRVKQSVLPVSDARLGYAMAAHGVKVGGGQCIGNVDPRCCVITRAGGRAGGGGLGVFECGSQRWPCGCVGVGGGWLWLRHALVLPVSDARLGYAMVAHRVMIQAAMYWHR